MLSPHPMLLPAGHLCWLCTEPDLSLGAFQKEQGFKYPFWWVWAGERQLLVSWVRCFGWARGCWRGAGRYMLRAGEGWVRRLPAVPGLVGRIVAIPTCSCLTIIRPALEASTKSYGVGSWESSTCKRPDPIAGGCALSCLCIGCAGPAWYGVGASLDPSSTCCPIAPPEGWRGVW